MVEAPFHFRLLHRYAYGTQQLDDLRGRKRPVAVKQNPVDRIQHHVRIFDQNPAFAFLGQSLPDSYTKRHGDRRRKGVADLPVPRSLPSEELPVSELLTVPALDTCNHLDGQHRMLDALHPWV